MSTLRLGIIRPLLAALVLLALVVLVPYAIAFAPAGTDWGDVLTRTGPILVGLAAVILAAYQAKLHVLDRTAHATREDRHRFTDAKRELYARYLALEDEFLEATASDLGKLTERELDPDHGSLAHDWPNRRHQVISEMRLIGSLDVLAVAMKGNDPKHQAVSGAIPKGPAAWSDAVEPFQRQLDLFVEIARKDLAADAGAPDILRPR
jgi:hypothetical protein